MISEGCKNDLDIPLNWPFGRVSVFPPLFKAVLISEEKAETPKLSQMVNLGDYLDHFYSNVSMEKIHAEDVLN